MSSSSRLAQIRAKRTGENPPPVSGNRPGTSIGSHAAFAQPMPNGMGYNMPPPPNNVRTARAMPPPPPQKNQFQQQQSPYNNPYAQNNFPPSPTTPTTSNNMPFTKLSVSDAIGLITLRLGRVEQWIIDTDHENEINNNKTASDIPDGHKVIDNSVLTTIINRLDSLEKNNNGNSNNNSSNFLEEIKKLNDQILRMNEDVTRHTLELAKNTEQVFRFNRELVETKDILKTFMLRHDLFVQETAQNFSDYEIAFAELERKISPEGEEEQEQNEEQGETKIVSEDIKQIIMTADLKNLIKEELATSSD